MTVYRGEVGTWKAGGIDKVYDVYRVYADDREIAMYEIHPDGALERLTSSGPVFMNTPLAIVSQESALKQCTEAWEERDRRSWKEVTDSWGWDKR